MPNLTQLDDRAVLELDHLLAQAWARGGSEEEKKVRQEFADKKNALRNMNREENQKLIDEAR